MSVDGKLDAKFSVNRAGRNLVLSESELDGTGSALGPGCVKTRMPRPSAQQLNPEGNVDESLLRGRPT